ncbi:hypothetical protein C0J52_26112 [Blattella germanica]|nr:hypothetical protein C0J52_26112 [Blattella germanica]
MYKRKLSGEDICRILEESDGSDGKFSEEDSDYMPDDADEDSENDHVSVTSEVDVILDAIENISEIDSDETSKNINVQITGGIFLGRNEFVWNKNQIPPQQSKIRKHTVIKSQLDVKLPPLEIIENPTNALICT